MAELLTCNSLHLMMLELSIEKIFVPRASDLDPGAIKKTAVKFRTLDNDWVTLSPQSKDYTPYNGSNSEEENFHSGKSVLFAIPESDFKHGFSNIAIEIRVFKEISKYIEMKPCYSLGFTRIPIGSLFNGILKELNDRKEMKGYYNYFHKREPISRSLKASCTIDNEDMSTTEVLASISVYARLNYFGKSIITEIERLPNGEFHVCEETCEGQPYQCHEVSREELESGFWGVESFQPSVNPRNLICICDMNIQSGVTTIDQNVNNQEERTIEPVSGDCQGKDHVLDDDNLDEGGLKKKKKKKKSKKDGGLRKKRNAKIKSKKNSSGGKKKAIDGENNDEAGKNAKKKKK